MKKVLDTYSSKNDINIKQIVAYKDNMLEIEEYRDGFKKDDTMNVMSVTKSVTSLLIGIAIDQGLIKSVDDLVMDYYKETYTPKRGEKTIFEVTIRHLLTMTAPYKGKSEPWTKVCTSEDWTLTTMDVLGGRKGITNGLMVLNNGVYNNNRIVSENWIKMMTKSYISADEKFGNQDYGFLWWLPHRTKDVIAAIGDGGNIIYVDRKNQIVVAITAHFKPMVFDRVEYIEKNVVEALAKR